MGRMCPGAGAPGLMRGEDLAAGEREVDTQWLQAGPRRRQGQVQASPVLIAASLSTFTEPWCDVPARPSRK